MADYKTPVLFIGHGSPMNILYRNDYTKSLQKLSAALPKRFYINEMLYNSIIFIILKHINLVM